MFLITCLRLGYILNSEHLKKECVIYEETIATFSIVIVNGTYIQRKLQFEVAIKIFNGQYATNVTLVTYRTLNILKIFCHSDESLWKRHLLLSVV